MNTFIVATVAWGKVSNHLCRIKSMVKKILIYWRDIPSQVIVQRGRRREKVQLSKRFQEAIDRAAMRAGKGSSDAYLSEWRRVSTTLETPEDLRALAELAADEFEKKYSDQRLLELIRAHGSNGG
jgi:hypothetical protein